MFILDKLAQHIVQALVDHPEAVEVTLEDGDDNKVTVHIKVASVDMGKVIGKQGRIANSIRTVMKAAGQRHHKKVYVEITD